MSDQTPLLRRLYRPDGLDDSGGRSLPWPEYRQIDLYDRRARVSVAGPAPSDAADLGTLLVPLRQVMHAHTALEAALCATDDLLWETRSSWQRYQGLPRQTLTQKMVAETYRMLRIVRIATAHARGHVDRPGGLVQFTCTFGTCALSLTITEAGLSLLAGFVAYVLAAEELPYSDTYVEWMLSQYFHDLVGEVRKFADEDRILYQFQHRAHFNRHFRFDCDNPRVRIDGDHLAFDINKAHALPDRFPIDFYTLQDQQLHIVPVEALEGGRLPRASLPLWRARTADGLHLPAPFRGRFTREHMVPGLPMT